MVRAGLLLFLFLISIIFILAISFLKALPKACTMLGTTHLQDHFS